MDVRRAVVPLPPGRLEGTTASRCKQEKEEKGRRDCADVDDSCTTDDHVRTYLPTTSDYVNNVLRNLHFCTSGDDNALVLVDQVGL